MGETLRVACVQVTAGTEVGANLDAAANLILQARAEGASFITTPENVALLETDREARWAKSEDPENPVSIPFFQALARETGAWLLAGSIAVRLPDHPGQMLANRSVLVAPDGKIAATYDKIHMFDVDLAGGESYRESSYFAPGERAVLADTPWGPTGLTICYDLRFAALYRALAKAGARLITIPASFTVPTGRAHWHALMRARAIETGCFIVAPAQTGTHARGRLTYGHSLIVSPWGEVLADAGEERGFVVADLDLAKVDEARGMVPSLRNDRAWTGPG